MENTMKLENWAFISNPYDAPELGRFMFHGNVYGHLRFVDGSPITTSYIINFKDGVFSTISGSNYILGEVDPNYEKVFPNAFQRIIEQSEKRFPTE